MEAPADLRSIENGFRPSTTPPIPLNDIGLDSAGPLKMPPAFSIGRESKIRKTQSRPADSTRLGLTHSWSRGSPWCWNPLGNTEYTTEHRTRYSTACPPDQSILFRQAAGPASPATSSPIGLSNRDGSGCGSHAVSLAPSALIGMEQGLGEMQSRHPSPDGPASRCFLHFLPKREKIKIKETTSH